MQTDSSLPWRRMIVANVIVTTLLFVYKTTRTYPGEQYTQLLADYHFGFTRRALIGAIVGFGFPVLPWWAPYVVGTVAWGATLALFLLAFRKTFGFTPRQLPLLVFTAGSPFFLKNFVQTLGYNDIYGCALALALLLLPARSRLYLVAAAAGSAVLILIHHIHILLYIPTVAVIVLLRHHLARRLTTGDLALGAGLAVALAALFFATQFGGAASVPIEEFTRHLRSRMAEPDNPAHDLTVRMFTSTLRGEIAATWTIMPENLARVPIYLGLIALHAPLVRYFAALIRALTPAHRQVVLAGVGLVSLGYLVVAAVAFDYSRWVSNWVTCMMLILFAAKTLPAMHEAPSIPLDDKRTKLLGWIVSAIPRVGTTKPF